MQDGGRRECVDARRIRFADLEIEVYWVSQKWQCAFHCLLVSTSRLHVRYSTNSDENEKRKMQAVRLQLKDCLHGTHALRGSREAVFECGPWTSEPSSEVCATNMARVIFEFCFLVTVSLTPALMPFS